MKTIEPPAAGEAPSEKIFKTHIEKAIDELGVGCVVTLKGAFTATPIRIEIEAVAKEGEIP
jgi:hypothetical protein